MLARALKGKGHDVLFIVEDASRLNRPENRYADISTPYPGWIKDYSPLPLWLVSNPIDKNIQKKIIADLQNCDLVLLNGYPIRFAQEIKRPHFVLLTGSDLLPLADLQHVNDLFTTYEELLHKEGVLPQGSEKAKLAKKRGYFNFAEKVTGVELFNIYKNEDYFKPRGPWYNLWFMASYKSWARKQIVNQRRSIRSAIGHLFFSKGVVPKGDLLLSEIGAPESKRLFNLMVDTESTAFVSAPANAVPRIFNLARLNWHRNDGAPKDFSDIDYKGNDVMIKGIALYAKKNPGQNLDVRLVRKGKDVERTVALCSELGISQHVTWLSEMSQQEVLEEYKQADIVFDQLDKSIVAMGGFEAMATGRPLIANSRPEIFEKLLGEKTAICQAETAAEVCEWLEKLLNDKTYREEIGKRSRQFVEKHFSHQAMADRILNAYYSAKN